MGQGDATLIIMPNGQTMLIDGGPYEAGEVIIQKLIEKGINHLDVIVSTHPDMDHIGGLIPIVEQMPVSLILDSGKTYSSLTYHTYRNNIKKRDTFRFSKGRTIYTAGSTCFYTSIKQREIKR